MKSTQQMNTIQIQGLHKPITTLVQGSDFFREENETEVFRVLDDYVAEGGNTIDTAFLYTAGQSETVIGRWMQKRGNREQIVILTKGAHPLPDGSSKMTPHAITSDVMTSLSRLQTEYIDLYALHRDDENVPVSVVIDCLNRHIQAGRMKAIGVSNWSCQRIHQANEYAAKHCLIGFSFNSPNLSLAKTNEPRWPGCVTADEKTIAWHKEYGIPLLSWSSMATGFFTERYTREYDEVGWMVRVYYSEDNFARKERARMLAREKGVSLLQIALAYVLNQPFPTAALFGPRNHEELRSSKEASWIKLTSDEVNWLVNG